MSFFAVACAESYSLGAVLTFCALFAFLIGFVSFNIVYFRRRYFMLKYTFGKEPERLWSPDDEFDPKKDVVTIEKDPNKDFVILAFPDIQVWQPFRLGKRYVIRKTIENAVKKAKPDLIVLLGDNAFYYSRQCYQKLVEIMDEQGVPWTAVFGNHDREGNADLAALADVMATGKRCLFQKGPRNLSGIGNYAINITQKGEIIHTLFFFDSGDAGLEYDAEKCRYIIADDFAKEKMPAFYRNRIHEGEHKGEIPIGEEWGTLSYDQVQYYHWLLDGVTALNGGKTPESSMFFHISLYEHNDAYFEWVQKGCDPEDGFGEINVKIGSAAVPSGMFDAILERGSTKNVIVGHDHENDLSLVYKGVRFSYAVKCGDECTTFAETLNGGSTLTIDAYGRGNKYENIHLPPEGKRHYDKMMWYYHDLDVEREKEWLKKEAAEAKEANNA